MINFRPYQRQCIDAFYDYHAKKGGHGVVVVPTAGGKSLIIGGLISEICQRWPDQRILVLSHVRELIKQNHEKIMLCWPTAPAGIYSASLNRRDAHYPIVVATIQSVYEKAAMLGHRDLLFIDEAHLLSHGGMGMYNKFIAALLAINPKMKICGFTATDYRMDSGLLTEGEGALFNDIIIEITLPYLLAEGYLTPPIGKSSLIQADLEGVRHTAGEFNIKDMAARFDQKAFIDAALDNDMPLFQGRKSIALFCATIENAEHVAEAMRARGIECESIDGEMKADEREGKLERFGSDKLRALASVGVITTGTDIPNIDTIVLFRATESPGLYQQIIGRGFRVIYAKGYDLSAKEDRIAAIAAGPKPNFLVLDHGGNILRHGAITHVQKPKKRAKGERREVVKPKGRICEICRAWWPLEITVCGDCKNPLVAERDPTSNLDVVASNADIMGTPFTRGEAAEWFDVDSVTYRKHISLKSGGNSMRVTYHCGIWSFDEFHRPEYIKKWWAQRTMAATPDTVESALKYSAALKKPIRILVKKVDNYPRIQQYAFYPAPQESSYQSA